MELKLNKREYKEGQRFLMEYIEKYFSILNATAKILTTAQSKLTS